MTEPAARGGDGVVDVDDVRRANSCIERGYQMHTMPQHCALID
jgi:hypothetical protein